MLFTGFLVFALFAGPIVRPEMRYYQSHLLMVRPKDGGDEKVEIESGGKTKKKRQKVEVKMEPGVYNRPSPTKIVSLLSIRSSRWSRSSSPRC